MMILFVESGVCKWVMTSYYNNCNHDGGTFFERIMGIMRESDVSDVEIGANKT